MYRAGKRLVSASPYLATAFPLGRGRGERVLASLQEHDPRVLTFFLYTLLPDVLLLSVAAQAGDQVVNTWAFRRHLRSRLQKYACINLITRSTRMTASFSPDSCHLSY